MPWLSSGADMNVTRLFAPNGVRIDLTDDEAQELLDLMCEVQYGEWPTFAWALRTELNKVFRTPERQP